MKTSDYLYAFVFKGQIAQESVSRNLEITSKEVIDSAEKIKQKMPFDLLDEEFISSALKMASVYVAINAFENSVRKFVQDRLLEEVGAEWWKKNVSKGIREQADERKNDEEQIRWHGSRGSSMIFYTQMGDLANIMASQINLLYFQPYIQSVEWSRQIFNSLERSRNVIMHGGELSMHDIERVAMNIRDWIRQVGS
jgi:hypothetical protein